ncbi:DUF2958 domain-containing protein [Aureimonas phyllosphaerae]|uniref:Uncharacterized protein n=1 Tax=Aureimonas phyllosphaerae TaxID=1166078 RepID=A0A7W6C238_9HYPH|nr:DUF2958 domain-containing protein [Aureimonas phyllosphaerae]MBB3938096.1 hypothetical protein [Aureimonas phyllosphaerae]MBB3962103.1 hypothetical protein [Aureimonas phyllosphaerae]SFF55973.1 Protein of unknown function [Aureimonas phyllosphaerae]
MKVNRESETVPFPVSIETRTILLRNAQRRLVFAERTDPRPLLRIVDPSGTAFLVTELQPGDLRHGYGLADQGDGNLAVGHIDLAALAARGAVLDAAFQAEFPLSVYIGQSIRQHETG